jgi:outer membrane autotransporter protein
MKKLSLIALFSALFLASQANAKDGVYVGADLVTSNAQYKYAGAIGSVGAVAQRRVDGTSVGAGLSVGYKKSFNGVFVAPELFYDYLNSSTHDYYYNNPGYKQDSLELRSRYGAKANLGYNFSNKFSAYATYGLASVDHVDNFPTATSVSRSQGKWKTAAIYGIGAVFNFNENWGIRAEFNTQRFNVPYSYHVGVMSKVRLNVLKTGLVYSF